MAPRATHASPRPAELSTTPPDFTLRDLAGGQAHLAEMVLLGPLVVFFVRGASDPRSAEQLRELRKRYAGLAEAGATLVVVVVDTPERVRAVVEHEKIGFPVLTDDGSVLAAWGLGELSEGSSATFVIDKGGTVQWRFVEGVDRASMPRDSELRTSITGQRSPAQRVLDWLKGHGGEGQAQS